MNDSIPEQWLQAIWMQADSIARSPANLSRDIAGWTLVLFEGLSRWRIEWTSTSATQSLTGEAARLPVSVAVHAKGSNGPVIEAHFQSAGDLLDAIIGHELHIPSWSEWLQDFLVCAPNLSEWANGIQSPVLTAWASGIRAEHPTRVVTMRVIEVLLNHRPLAEMLVELAPFAILNDPVVTSALLRDPDQTCRQMWDQEAQRHIRLLPWCLSVWSSDPALSFQDTLHALGIDEELQASLVCMHPTYLHRLAEPILDFKQPDLTRCFLRLARPTILADGRQQAETPYQAVTRVGVAGHVIDAAWDAWSSAYPTHAEAHWSHKPRRIV